MRKKPPYILALYFLFIGLLFFPLALFGQTKAECETIVFIEEDGASYKKYVDIRTDNGSPSPMIFNSIKNGKDPKQTYLYINPKDYQFKVIPNKSYNLMIFEGNSYSFMEKGNMMDDGELRLQKGTFTFTNFSKEESSGYFGYYWQNGIYKKFSFTWILPPNFRVLEKSCNQEGEWVLHNNTLTFYGENINNIVFEIQYCKSVQTDVPFFKGREVTVIDTLNMKKEDISIEVWDNNQEDGDIISLSLNGEYLCKNLEVKKEKVQFKIPNLQGKNLLILHAENLGSIPPNTAALKIVSGKETKEVVLNSDQGKSEAIQILIDP